MSFDNWFSLIISICGIFSSLIVAKITTKSELKKIAKQQSHEINLNATKAFAKMNGAVNAYTVTPTTQFQREALVAVGEFTPYASEKMLTICTSLENAINSKNGKLVVDFMEHLCAQWSTEHPTKPSYEKRLKQSK